MNLSKIAKICKESKEIVVRDVVDEAGEFKGQWIGTSRAYYASVVPNLLPSEYLNVFGVSQADKDTYDCVTVTDTLSDIDTPLGSEAEIIDCEIKRNGVSYAVVYCNNGIYLIPKAFLEPTKKEPFTMLFAHPGMDDGWFVIKSGLVAIGIISALCKLESEKQLMIFVKGARSDE